MYLLKFVITMSCFFDFPSYLHSTPVRHFETRTGYDCSESIRYYKSFGHKTRLSSAKRFLSCPSSALSKNTIFSGAVFAVSLR